MTMRAARWTAIWMGLAIGVLPAAPEWQEPRADLRLRVHSTSQWTHPVRVDLPERLSGEVRGVRAMLPGGREVPASPVLLGDRIVAVEVAVPRLGSADRTVPEGEVLAPVEVYLLKEAAAGSGTPIAQRQPAMLHRAVRSTRQLTTRPFTAAEALRLLGDAPASRRARAAEGPRARTYFYWTWDAAAVGKVPDPAKAGDPGESRVATMHWATALRLEGSQAVAFGANQDHVAWFLYLDGKPVADWRTSVREESGGRFGPVVELDAGLHLFECIVVQQEGEPLPEILWRSRGGKEAAAVPAELQHTIRVPETVLVERRDGPSGGFAFARFEQRLRARTEDAFLDLALAPVQTDGKPLPAAAFVVGGAKRPEAWVRAPFLPPVRVPFGDGELEFPARPGWVAPTTFEVDVRLAEGPAILSAGQAYPAEVRLELLDHLEESAAARLTLHWQQLGPAGKTLRSGSLPLAADRLGAATRFDLPLLDDTHTVELRTCLDGLEVARRRSFRILRPQDDLAGLHASGRSLFLDRERAVLVCAPLAQLATPPRSGRKGAPHLLVLDDFWATVSGPEANFRPEAALGGETDYAVFRLALARGRALGSAGELRKFELLPTLLERQPDEVLLALGRNDLEAGADPRELCRHLLFMAQAAQARGIRPSLLALPSLPGIAPEATREAALLVKELGMRLGVPVVDAFSAERLGHFDGPFSAYFATADGAVTLTTPNDAGRRLLADLVRQVLCP